jgi:hypothetical protein
VHLLTNAILPIYIFTGQPGAETDEPPIMSSTERGYEASTSTANVPSDRLLVRLKQVITVADLSLKSYKARDKKYRMYLWLVFCIF